MNRRSLFAGLGVAVAGLGAAMVVAPDLAADVGRGQALVTLVGLLAVVQGLRAASARRGTEVGGAETGDPEIPPPLPSPGDDFDDRLATVRTYNPRTTTSRRDVRERLERAAVAALVRRERCSRAAAREMLRLGTWTDDPVAAQFFAEAGAVTVPLRQQLGVLLRGGRFDWRVRRAVAAIAGEADR